MFELAIAATIPGLFALRGPSHISGLVVAIIVWKAVQRVVLGRAIANISKKGGEGLLPCFAQFNASSSVSWIGRQLGIRASSFHAFPRFVFGSFTNAMLPAITRTRCGLFALKASCGNDLCLRAGSAHATPNRITARVFSGVTDDSQVSESLSSQVLEVRAYRNRMCFSHDVRLLVRRVLWLEPSSVQPLARLVHFIRTPPAAQLAFRHSSPLSPNRIAIVAAQGACK